MPYQIVPARWSFSLHEADFSQASVTMTRGGSPVSLQLEQLHQGFGDNTIVWVPAGMPPGRPTSDQLYDMSVNGVRVGGSTSNFSYQVKIIDP